MGSIPGAPIHKMYARMTRALWINNDITYTGTGHNHNGQGLHDASGAHDPGEAQEQNDPQDVLQTGQVHPD